MRYSNDPKSDLLHIDGKKIMVNNVLSSNNSMVIKNALLNSIGFSRLPEYYIKNELDNGILEYVFGNNIGKNKITLYAIYHNKQNQSFFRFS